MKDDGKILDAFADMLEMKMLAAGEEAWRTIDEMEFVEVLLPLPKGIAALIKAAQDNDIIQKILGVIFIDILSDGLRVRALQAICKGKQKYTKQMKDTIELLAEKVASIRREEGGLH